MLMRNWTDPVRGLSPPANSGVSMSPSGTVLPPPSSRPLLVLSTLEPPSSSSPPVSDLLLLTRCRAQTDDTRADAFNRYKTATGAVNDAATGLLRITSTQLSNLQSLFFTTGGRSFEFTANAQLWPRSLNTFIGGSSSSIYLVVNDIGSPTGSGFATTPFTTATTN